MICSTPLCIYIVSLVQWRWLTCLFELDDLPPIRANIEVAFIVECWWRHDLTLQLLLPLQLPSFDVQSHNGTTIGACSREQLQPELLTKTWQTKIPNGNYLLYFIIINSMWLAIIFPLQLVIFNRMPFSLFQFIFILHFFFYTSTTVCTAITSYVSLKAISV